MALTSDTGCEIKKFDNNCFALWKEMMQDVLIIRHQIEVNRHNNKPTTMPIEEWQSLDKFARLTIRMHLTKNIYFGMAKETTAFALWEKL